MPQLDLYHQPVRAALIKDGWHITDDPFIIEFKGLRLYADLGAERPLAAEKQQLKIVVEIKVFAGPSLISDLQKAVGQYGIYRTFLKHVAPGRELFLAVAYEVYRDFFQRPAIAEIITDHQIKLLVFDPSTQEVVRWIN